MMLTVRNKRVDKSGIFSVNCHQPNLPEATLGHIPQELLVERFSQVGGAASFHPAFELNGNDPPVNFRRNFLTYIASGSVICGVVCPLVSFS